MIMLLKDRTCLFPTRAWNRRERDVHTEKKKVLRYYLCCVRFRPGSGTHILYIQYLGHYFHIYKPFFHAWACSYSGIFGVHSAFTSRSYPLTTVDCFRIDGCISLSLHVSLPAEIRQRPTRLIRVSNYHSLNLWLVQQRIPTGAGSQVARLRLYIRSLDPRVSQHAKSHMAVYDLAFCPLVPGCLKLVGADNGAPLPYWSVVLLAAWQSMRPTPT
eukprot:6189571-Pleurochrysis_carterae.AAC.1